MTFQIEEIAKIAAPVLTAVIGFIVKKYLEAKPKLITYLIHVSAIPLDDEHGTKVNSHSIVVRNSGKRTAHNVRIGHINLTAFQLSPQLSHEINRDDNGGAEILIPTLVPNEQVTVSYLYFPPTTWNQINDYCKSDEMSAKYINVIPTMQPSKPLLALIWGLLFIGVSTLVYWAIFLLWYWAG